MSNNNREILSDKKLEKLKCAKCLYYLSCGPVFVKHSNGEAICGRCTDQLIKAVTRNGHYEELAELFIFPCMYSSNGCRLKIKFSKVWRNSHERICSHGPRVCVMEFIEQCDWSGKSSGYLRHFEENHPELILKIPVTYNCSTSCYLFEQFDILFSIYVRVDSHRIEHILFGEIMKNVEYILKVKRDKVEIIKQGELNMGYEIPSNKMSFSVNSLKDILGGIDNIIFELKITNYTSVSIKRESEPPEENEIGPSNAKKAQLDFTDLFKENIFE